MAGDTRDRMIEAAVSALKRDGVAGMSFTDVLRESGAARGAIYHHFPGGKSQLVAEAARGNGEDVRALFDELPAPDPVAVVRGFLDLIRPVVQESVHGSGCAVAAVAMARAGARAGAGTGAGEGAGEHAHDDLHAVTARAIGSWIGALAGRLRVAGLTAADAADLASLLVATLQGAHVLARATGGVEPFDQAARALTALVETRYPR